MSSQSTKPFSKRIFFLDVNGYPHKQKLVKDIELLGGKEEVCLNKNVSIVVSNKAVNTEFKVPTPVSSNRAISPGFFKDSPLGRGYSPNSPNFDPRDPMPLSRTQSLLQKAREKSQGGTKNIAEICKQWNITIVPLRTFLSKVENYKRKYYKNAIDKKTREVPSENEQKIRPPMIKFEDAEKKYKPKYKSFGSWSNAFEKDLFTCVSKVVKSVTQPGSVWDPTLPILKEAGAKLPQKSPLCSRNASFMNETATFSKVTGSKSMFSNSVSVCGSKVVKESAGAGKKSKKQQKKSKKQYCEICTVNFTDSESHYAKQSHSKFLENPSNYKEVQDIISSLPNVEDFLESLERKEKLERQMYYYEASKRELGFIDPSHYNTDPLSKDTIEDSCTASEQHAIINVHTCNTEEYVLNPNDYVSASCSSSSTALPYLEKPETCIATKRNIDPNTQNCNTAKNMETSLVSQNTLLKAQKMTFSNSCDMLDQTLCTSTFVSFKRENVNTLCDNVMCGYDDSCDMEIGAIDRSRYDPYQNSNFALQQIDPLNNPVTDIYNLHAEAPLDLSNNSKFGNIACNNDNFISDEAHLISMSNILNRELMNLTLLKEAESAITIDITSVSNDSTGTKGEMKILSESVVTMDVTNENDSASVIDVTKVASIGDSAKTNDVITLISKSNEADAVDLIDTSNIPVVNNPAGMIDFTKVSNDDLCLKVDGLKAVTPVMNSVDRVTNSKNKEANLDEDTEIYSSGSESDSGIHVMVAHCIDEVTKSLAHDEDEEDSPVEELNNKSQDAERAILECEETQELVLECNKPPELVLECNKPPELVMECSEPPKLVLECNDPPELDLECNEPPELVLEGSVPPEQFENNTMAEPKNDSANEIQQCFTDVECHSENEPVNLSIESKMVESPTMPTGSPTKRKYFHIKDTDGDDQASRNPNVDNLDEHPDVSSMSPPAKRMCLQSEVISSEPCNNPDELLNETYSLPVNFPLQREYSQAMDGVACCKFTENFHEMADTAEHRKSYQNMVEISNLENQAPLNFSPDGVNGVTTPMDISDAAEQEDSKSIVQNISKNYAGVLKLCDALSESGIMPNLLSSEDAYIVLDESRTSVDCVDCDSPDYYDFKIDIHRDNLNDWINVWAEEEAQNLSNKAELSMNTNADDEVKKENKCPYGDIAIKTVDDAVQNQANEDSSTTVAVSQEDKCDIVYDNQTVHADFNAANDVKMNTFMHDRMQCALDEREANKNEIIHSITDDVSKVEECKDDVEMVENMNFSSNPDVISKANEAGCCEIEHPDADSVSAHVEICKSEKIMKNEVRYLSTDNDSKIEECEGDALDTVNSASHLKSSGVCKASEANCCEIEGHPCADSVVRLSERETENFKPEKMHDMKEMKNGKTLTHEVQFSRSTSASSEESIPHSNSSVVSNSQSCEDSFSSSTENNSNLNGVSSSPASSPDGYVFPVANSSAVGVMEKNYCVVYLNSAITSK